MIRTSGASGSMRRFGKPVEHRVHRHPHLGAGDVHAEAHVRATGEAEVRLRRAVRVEALGIVPPRGVVVGGAEVHLDDRTGGDVDAAQLDVLR